MSSNEDKLKKSVLQLGLHGQDNQMPLIGRLIMQKKLYQYQPHFSFFPTMSVSIPGYYITF